MDAVECEFRFYEELNDFLPPALRKRAFAYRFRGTPAVKDAIEALGVPHTEVDLILVDGASVRFSHKLRGGERVAVYPVFERLDISPLARLRPAPLRTPRFVADVHLGTLARHLRLLGFDTAYDNRAADAELVKHKVLTHAHYVRPTEPALQRCRRVATACPGPSPDRLAMRFLPATLLARHALPPPDPPGRLTPLGRAPSRNTRVRHMPGW